MLKYKTLLGLFVLQKRIYSQICTEHYHQSLVNRKLTNSSTKPNLYISGMNVMPSRERGPSAAN